MHAESQYVRLLLHECNFVTLQGEFYPIHHRSLIKERNQIMSVVYTVPLKEVIREFQLEEIFLPEGSDTLVSRSDLNRPGLALAGFFGHFDPERIQLIGRCEHTYLTPFDHEEKRSHIMGFMSQKPVAVIITSSRSPNFSRRRRNTPFRSCAPSSGHPNSWRA